MIPMQINTERISFLVGSEAVLTHMDQVAALPMFCDIIVDFLADLSRRLMADERSRKYQDIMSYAYWIRKSSLERVKEAYPKCGNNLGRGVSFHIAPSNVPVNFAVSMTSALLAGNSVVIRVSDRDFEQVTIICDAINDLLSDRYKAISDRFCIVRYPHDDGITGQLSGICDIRIIWGGDETIRRIRSTGLPPRAIELTFADRYSIALIDSDKYLTEDPQKVARGFYTDTYYSDQNACSSPRLIVWLGNNKEMAKTRFFDSLSRLVKEQYIMKPVQAVDKYEAFCKLSMNGIAAKLIFDDNLVMRVLVNDLNSNFMDYKIGGGYFFEYDAESIDEIVPLLGKQCQTVAVLGVDKNDVFKLVKDNGVRGVDRIVDLSQTMALEFVWDGYRMIEAMTRVVYIGQ